MFATNVIAYAAQIAVIVLVCAGLPRLLRLRAPGVQYVFWRIVLLVCLALPLVQPFRAREAVEVMSFVPAPSAATVPNGGVPNQGGSVPEAPFDWRWAIQIVILAGIGMRLAWMAIGVARLDALRRRSAGSPALGFDDLQSAIGTTAPILWSAEVRHPVTFGLLRPVVLLPTALKPVDHAAQRAVVAHELHHVKRRDWGWVIGEEVVRSIFWFHPAMWWLISRVQLARETVVDELSILVTNARRTYLDTLLAFADDTGLGSSPAFSARRHLFHRVMLLSKEGGMSSTRIAVVCGALMLALGAGAWTAVSAFPLYTRDQTASKAKAQTPPRDPLSPLTYHRQAVELYQKLQQDSTLTADQKLETIEKAIAAEDRAIDLNPDYAEAMIYKNLLLRMQASLSSDAAERARLLQQAEELRSRAVALRKAQGIPESGWSGAGTPPPPPPPPPPGLAPMPDDYRQALEMYKPLRIGGEFRPPMKVKDVKPIYPAEAQAARVQGVIIIEAIIDPLGQVVAARVLRSIAGLDDAALAAVRQWEFTPTMANGTPTPIIMTVTVNFALQ